MCHLLGIRTPEELRHHPLRGQIFESWVVAEISKRRIHQGLDPNLRHFRDAQGLEVDIVLEAGAEVILAEAKSAATVNPDFFKSLRRLGSSLEGVPGIRTIHGRLIYGGDTRQRQAEIDVVPWNQVPELDWG